MRGKPSEASLWRVWLQIKAGAPCLVVHDAAVGVQLQGEGDTAAKCVHGLGQGEQKIAHSSDSTH